MRALLALGMIFVVAAYFSSAGWLIVFDPPRYIRWLNAMSRPSVWDREWRKRCEQGECTWLGVVFLVVGVGLFVLGVKALFTEQPGL